MSRWSEREIARKLAERDELEPPPGLLEKIKSEIPPMIPARADLPEIDRRRPSMPPRQRWLIAASLVAMAGAGLFAVHLQMEVPSVEETARTAEGVRQPEPHRGSPPPPPAVPPPAARALKQQLAQPSEAPAPKPLNRETEEELKSLGYAGSADGSVQGGYAGGALAGESGSKPAAPPAAEAPPPPPPPPVAVPEAQARADKDKKEAAAEPSLLDERQAEKRGRAPVESNEVGQQGPGTTDRPQFAPPAPQALAKAAGAGPLWQVPSSLPIALKTAAGTASYEAARRSIAAGSLPDPATVRVGEILSSFDRGDAPLTEGASTPFVHGPQYRLLRLHPGGAGPAQVSFNPLVVARYRSIGTGVSALYEIELRPGASHQDALVAVLRLENQIKTVSVGDLDSSWDKASPGFRLVALAAEFAEILKGSPVDSSALHRLSAEIGKLPKGPKATELADLVARVGRIRG